MDPQVVVSDEALGSVAADAVVVTARSANGGVSFAGGAETIDPAFDGRLLEYLQDSGFKGKVGEIVIVPTLGRLPSKALVVVGLGSSDEPTPADVRRAAGVAGRRLADRSTVAVHAPAPTDEISAAIAEGIVLGSYRYTKYQSDPRPAKLERVLVLGGSAAGLDKGSARASAARLARDLTNTPAADLTPAGLAQKAQEVADVNGLECKIFDEDELANRGFGGIMGVSQGSDAPPRLIELRYRPEGAAGKVVLVGKGVTFDSGGLSMKDPKSMETMKTDKGGAASVIGAMSALGRLGVKCEVVGIVPTTENMVNGRAIKPGDVITHYGGRTTEVLNTDAEGRLILGDALAYASEQQPDALVDVATLTGSIMVALGRKVSGLFSNDDALRDELEVAARAAGESVWPMPLYDDYKGDLDSEIADVKNIGTRYGGSIVAALFLRDFVAEGIPWAHFDIAGTGRAESDYDEISKGGTGVPTRTLLHWLESR